MTRTTSETWQNELGLSAARGPNFFASPTDLNALTLGVSRAHVVRRAFDLLALDGVLCADRSPLVYFKYVSQIDNTAVAHLHRTFWNHGGAPLLVLVSSNDVHVYSGLIPPVPEAGGARSLPSLVDQLTRASASLKALLPSVESGEFFRRHHKFFDPIHRVDRHLLDNLQATRQKLLAPDIGTLSPDLLDAILCRLVFTCYLFDREIVGEGYLRDIGIGGVSHLRDVLALKPRSQAKKYLYKLFRKLGEDFNGDLFSDNLDSEEHQLAASYIAPLDDFFHATDVATGQGSFWPYDFAAIPVEVVSAIYERFLKGGDRRDGAVYTPRFLAELVLDVALADTPSLLGGRYLDPAAGSGIFLVGLFNRIAEEWKQKNPAARNDRRARELRDILCNCLCGVDINPTACRITAFSLYLAYLDQLSPRDIQELQQKGHKLPRLVHHPAHTAPVVEGNIWCNDFFATNPAYPTDARVVVGNPPWGSSATPSTAAAQWCATADTSCPIPDKQLAAAFAWKAPHHVVPSGRICLVLPHGTLFNHSKAAIAFQQVFFKRYATDKVLNLADYQFFLFEEARHPAIVVSYRRQTPEGRGHQIQYWRPKADWLVTRADVVSILPEDRSTLSLGDILDNLASKDAPQIWKLHYWATGRDRRLIERLSLYSRLRDHVRQSREPANSKRWMIAEGFQPLGIRDDEARAQTLRMPSRLFVEATSSGLDLLLLAKDCRHLPSIDVRVRTRSNKVVDVFRAPHVLVAKGFTSIAYADFDVSFRHALRGICGPNDDRDLLMFLAVYLRSSLARYYLFETSSNWGVARQDIHVEELLRLPFPMPDEQPSPRRAWEIVRAVSRELATTRKRIQDALAERTHIVREAEHSLIPLIHEYFDLTPTEEIVIADTVRVIVPSVRPTRNRNNVPTMTPSGKAQREAYTRLLAIMKKRRFLDRRVVHAAGRFRRRFCASSASRRRKLSPSMAMISAWWMTRSMSAVAEVALGKMPGQPLKARLVVRTRLFFS